jgi:DNA-binding Lrp family transcriptional regulator
VPENASVPLVIFKKIERRVVRYLQEHGRSTGAQLTLNCISKRQGERPSDLLQTLFGMEQEGTLSSYHTDEKVSYELTGR